MKNIEKYGITKLSIDDDQFLFKRERAVEILEGLSGLQLEIEMANGLSPQFIDDKIAQLLKKAGLKIAVLAIESGSERVLHDIIKKPLKIKQIQKCVKSLRNAGLDIHTFFIIGFPGETANDRQITRDFIIDTGFDWNGIFIATPFKGSRLYELCWKKGYIDKQGLVDPNIYQCQIMAPGIEPQSITKEAYMLNLDVNFVNNYNLSHGNYIKAAGYFSSITTRYPEHAFAHYYLAKALELLPNRDKHEIMKHYDIYKDIICNNRVWKEYVDYFNLA